MSDIETARYNCFLYVVEVGSRGNIDKQNENRLKSFLRNISKKVGWSKVKHVLTKLVILGIYSIYKEEHLWYKPAVLKPNVEMNMFAK